MSTCTRCQTPVTAAYCAACGQRASEEQTAPPLMMQPSPTSGTRFSRTIVVPSSQYVAPMPGLPVQSMGATDDNRFTADADRILRSTGERIAWQGKPSIMSLVSRVAAWAVCIMLASAAALALRQGFGWVLFWSFVAVIHTGAGYLGWTNTTYRLTSQRLEYSAGTFSKSTAASPLNHIATVTILRPFPWNLLGLGHLELDIPDRARPARNGGNANVRLLCLPNLETTRDLIHSSSAITNQVWDQHRFSH